MRESVSSGFLNFRGVGGLSVASCAFCLHGVVSFLTSELCD